MSEIFKINMYFDEKGEELEEIISYFLISELEKNKKNNCSVFEFG